MLIGSPTRRTRRTASALVALAIGAASLGACGSDDDEGTVVAQRFTHIAAQRCTELINDLDPGIAEASTDAVLGLLTATRGDDAPGADELARWADALGARADQLQSVLDELAALEPGADEETAWADLLDEGRARVGVVRGRADLAASADWARIRDEFSPIAADIADGYLEAIDELGLTGRDCEVVLDHLGNDPDADAFLDAASLACTTIVSRREVIGYTTDRVQEAIVAALAGNVPEVSPELEAELATLAEEWNRTATDLRSVPTEAAPDPDEWATTVEAAEQRAEVFTQRLEAVRSGSEDELVGRFDPREASERPGFDALVADGLDQRDCRSITT